jgi:hypothetical protein
VQDHGAEFPAASLPAFAVLPHGEAEAHAPEVAALGQGQHVTPEGGVREVNFKGQAVAVLGKTE